MACDKEAQREEREYYIKLKVCVRCHKEDAEPGIQTCWECAEEARVYANERLANMVPEEKAEKNRKNCVRSSNIRKDRIAKGLCERCGKRPPRENRQTCNECALSNNRYDKKRRAKTAKSPIPRELRNGYGLCRQCANPLAKPTDKLCSECYKAKVDNINKINQNPTPAMLKARENFANLNREVNTMFFAAFKIQKQDNRAAIENFERMCKSCR